MPWRRLRVLVEQLPLDAAYVRAVCGERVEWGVGELLLARCAHLLELAIYQQADPKKRGQVPTPVPTPWDDRPVVMTDAEKVARLQALARRERERRASDGD